MSFLELNFKDFLEGLPLSKELPSFEDSTQDSFYDKLPCTEHPTFFPVQRQLKKLLDRFPDVVDESIFSDMFLFYLLASKKYLDHRKPLHVFRLILAIHFFQKKLSKAMTLFPSKRHLEIRWLSTSLLFPFSSKPVLGCVLGFNAMDRYELFDEGNIQLALEKYFPELKLVKQSCYYHSSQNKKLNFIYFEIEKKNRTQFSLSEKGALKNALKEKIEKSIQPLSPNIFIGYNDEEIYKNILILSQEIQSLEDLPQVCINIDQQTRNEIIFRVTLVHASPFHRFSLKERFVDASFTPQRSLIVRHLDDHPIEAHLFRLHLPRHASLLRTDGSLDFYSARKKITALLTSAIGEFRDYNGGIIIKQQELLQSFKEQFPKIVEQDPELLDAFFYSITPLENQVLVNLNTLCSLFSYYIENRKNPLSEGDYSFNVYNKESGTILAVHGNHPSLFATINDFLGENSFHPFKSQEMTYSLLNTATGIFFNCIFTPTESQHVQLFIQNLEQSLEQWQKKIKNRQILRIALEYSVVSLDPRIGGENVSGSIIRLLFEGLTRFDQRNNIENALAQSVEISPDTTQYIFKLRTTFWNDGSPVSAYDFEYSWKKILSPDFKTSFAYLFYPIKNAKEAKEGKASVDQIGVKALDNWTLKVDLERPTSYFLQLTANPLYSPVHRLIDQQHPEWPYQCENHYPCNGPFQLIVNQPNQGYKLIKNPFYWDRGRIVLEQIILTQTNSALANQAFQKKEIDWIGNPFGNWNSTYPKKGDQVISVPNALSSWLVFNTNTLPFSNHKLRQAFAYAIRRSELIRNSSIALNSAYSIHSPNYGIAALKQFPDEDEKKAREFLKEGLEELGLKKEDLPPLDLIFPEGGIREHTANTLYKQIAQYLGIHLRPIPLPWHSHFKNMTEGNFKLGIVQWTSFVSDPIYTLNAFRSANQNVNLSKWENADFQHWLSLAEQEVNPFQYSSHLRKAEEILSDKKPIIPLFYSPIQAVVSPDLQGVYPTLCGFFNISQASFKQ